MRPKRRHGNPSVRADRAEREWRRARRGCCSPSRLLRSGCVRGDSAVDQLTKAWLADDLPLASNGLASADCYHRPPLDLETLPGRVVGTMVEVCLPDRRLIVRIP